MDAATFFLFFLSSFRKKISFQPHSVLQFILRASPPPSFTAFFKKIFLRALHPVCPFPSQESEKWSSPQTFRLPFFPSPPLLMRRPNNFCSCNFAYFPFICLFQHELPVFFLLPFLFLLEAYESLVFRTSARPPIFSKKLRRAYLPPFFFPPSLGVVDSLSLGFVPLIPNLVPAVPPPLQNKMIGSVPTEGMILLDPFLSVDPLCFDVLPCGITLPHSFTLFFPRVLLFERSF